MTWERPFPSVPDGETRSRRSLLATQVLCWSLIPEQRGLLPVEHWCAGGRGPPGLGPSGPWDLLKTNITFDMRKLDIRAGGFRSRKGNGGRCQQKGRVAWLCRCFLLLVPGAPSRGLAVTPLSVTQTVDVPVGRVTEEGEDR